MPTGERELMAAALANIFTAADMPMDDATTKALSTHWQLLMTANESFNLTAAKDRADAAERHYLDSLLPLPVFKSLLKEGGSIVDLGAGNGFPGLALALALSGTKISLLEATGKKCAFLEDAANALGLSERVQVLNLRAEEAGRAVTLRGSFRIATARGLAALNVLLEYAFPLLEVGGFLLAYKGGNYQAELDEAANALKELGGSLEQVFACDLPICSEKRTLLAIRKNEPTPEKYPRRPGMPTKRPL